MENVKANTVQAIVRANVVPRTNVYTDEHRAYTGLAPTYHHHTVNHGTGEYVRHFHAHTNSIESVWALLKRQIIGVHHWGSPKHLDRYVGEMTYRLNRRALPKGDRVNNLLAQIEGPKPYKVLTA